MDRTIHARRVISGDPERLQGMLVDHISELLMTASGEEATAPDGDGSFLISLRAIAAGVEASKQVRVHLGEVRKGETWLRIPLRWKAEPGRRLFASLDGCIELEVLNDDQVSMEIFGRYDPPFGRLGEAGDILLGNMPHTAVTRLLDRLASTLVDAALGSDAPVQPSAQPGTMTVVEIMTTTVLTISEDESLREAAKQLLTARITGAPVVDSSGQVVGVISRRDLLDKVAQPPSKFGRSAARAQERHEAWTVAGACSRPARTTSTASTVRDAATEMARAGVDRLVVMNGAQVVGIVTSTDVLEVLVRSDDAILQGVRMVLFDGPESKLDATVSDGVVTLVGTLHLRSTGESMTALVSQVDGVLRVVTDGVEWDKDDVTVPPIPPNSYM